MSTRQPGCLRRGSRVTLLKSRERPRFHSLVKTCQGLQNAPLAGEEGARKFRTKIPVHAEQILKDQYLSIASRARANADRRNSKAGADITGEVCRHALEHNRESAKLFQSSRLTDDICPESLLRPWT